MRTKSSSFRQRRKRLVKKMKLSNQEMKVEDWHLKVKKKIPKRQELRLEVGGRKGVRSQLENGSSTHKWNTHTYMHTLIHTYTHTRAHVHAYTSCCYTCLTFFLLNSGRQPGKGTVPERCGPCNQSGRVDSWKHHRAGPSARRNHPRPLRKGMLVSDFLTLSRFI